MKALQRRMDQIENTVSGDRQWLVFSVEYFEDEVQQEDENKRILKEYLYNHPEDKKASAFFTVDWSKQKSHFIYKFSAPF